MYLSRPRCAILLNKARKNASVKSCIMNALEPVRGGGPGVQDPLHLPTPSHYPKAYQVAYACS